MLPAGLVQAESWISAVGSFLELLLILRIVQLGLIRGYPAFVVFLVCDLCRDVALRCVAQAENSPSYILAWSFSAPLLWVALWYAVLEVYRRFYVALPVAREVRAMLMATALLASVIVTLPISVGLLDHISPMASWQEAIRVTNRFIFMAAALLLWTQRIYFFRTSPQLSHNVRIHRTAFTLCLSADASIRFLSAMSDPVIAMRANIGCTLLFCASLVIWLSGFRRDGEAPEGVFHLA